MKNKGQALVEFVLILPVLLLLIFAFLDISRIMIGKSHLESVMNDVIKLVDDDKNIDEINNYLKKSTDYKIKLDIEYNEYMIITLKSSIDLITPGLKKILNNPYVINVERSIIYE